MFITHLRIDAVLRDLYKCWDRFKNRNGKFEILPDGMDARRACINRARTVWVNSVYFLVNNYGRNYFEYKKNRTRCEKFSTPRTVLQSIALSSRRARQLRIRFPSLYYILVFPVARVRCPCTRNVRYPIERCFVEISKTFFCTKKLIFTFVGFFA